MVVVNHRRIESCVKIFVIKYVLVIKKSSLRCNEYIKALVANNANNRLMLKVNTIHLHAYIFTGCYCYFYLSKECEYLLNVSQYVVVHRLLHSQFICQLS